MQQVTNLFCIIGKHGTGKDLIINTLFSNIEFVNKGSFKRFITGTTRPMKPSDVNGIDHFFYTDQEYFAIPKKEIIEARSYESASRKIMYYFTLRKHLEPGKNYIGKCSIFQYEELKKWSEIEQLKNPIMRYHIYPIYVNSSPIERANRLIKNVTTEDELYEMCTRLLFDRFEYRSLMVNKVIDKDSHLTCTVENTGPMESNGYMMSKIIKYINDRI